MQKLNGKVEIQTTMPCLTHLGEKLGSVLARDTVKVARVKPMVCPSMLPKRHIHSNNGTYLGYDTSDADTVYIRCAACKNLPQLPDVPPHLLQAGWLPLTEEKLRNLLTGTKATPKTTSNTSGEIVPKLKTNGLL